MTNGKLYTSLTAYTILATLTSHFQRTRLKTLLTDKHYSLDSEDDFRSSCRNISHQWQFFSELPSPEQSHYNLWTKVNQVLQCYALYCCYLRKFLIKFWHLFDNFRTTLYWFLFELANQKMGTVESRNVWLSNPTLTL